MNLIISPKDNPNKLKLENVESFFLEGETLGIVLENGQRRNYPLRHIWWYGTEPDFDSNRTRPV